MPNQSEAMKSQIVAMLVAKARGRSGQIDDPMTRYALGINGGTGPTAAELAAKRRAEMAAKREQQAKQTEENEAWARLDKALVYSPSVIVERGPGVLSPVELGIGGEYNRERGGYLAGLDTSRLEPRDIEFLKQYYAQQQKKGESK